MRFGRFEFQGREIFGYVIDDETVGVARPEDQDALGGQAFKMAESRILAPVLPTKIVGVGLNYKAHAAEMGKPLPQDPLLFIKPATALLRTGGEIVLPNQSAQVEYEGELAVVIGKTCRHVSAADAPQFILGYTCMNDVTARDLQKKDVQYTRAKGFDTFAPAGPFLTTEIDPTNLKIETYVNGQQKQAGNTSDMIFPVFKLVEFISSVMTLLPGDIITTGTPPGVGPIKPGDLVEVRIPEIGTLRNTVVAGI